MRFIAIAATVLAAGPAVAADGQKLSITIYNDDTALVQDVRTLDIPAGRSRVELKDVSNEIRSPTVSLTAPDLSIVEQNFDFDLLTPEKLMEKAVGKQVQIVRTNPGNGQQVTETATVLAANNGVVLKIGDRVEILRDDGAPTRVIFDGVPENLRARPTLSVLVNSARAGRRDATLTYLTGGLQWKADYVAVFDEQAGKMDFQGWVTLINTTSTTFADVKADLIAGNVRSNNNVASQYGRSRIQGVTQAGSETANGPRVGDYHLYPLKERTTIAANQQKQVGFIEANGVEARKVYQYRAPWFSSSRSPIHVDSVIQFSNSRGGGLAAALPEGTVRIYMHDTDGSLKFIGENNVGHVPQGSDVSLKTGDAFDVTIQPTVDSEESLDLFGQHRRYAMTYVLHNAKSEPVTVQVRQDDLFSGHTTVLSESVKSRRIDSSQLQWDVPVAAGGDAKLTFKVETNW